MIELKGRGASAGTVTGTARVITDVMQINRVQHGDVLVCRMTDPGWTPVFSRLKGLVSQDGGILSHPAIIARECGIPAVVACAGLLESVKDGDTVVIDGAAGTVTVLAPDPNADDKRAMWDAMKAAGSAKSWNS